MNRLLGGVPYIKQFPVGSKRIFISPAVKVLHDVIGAYVSEPGNAFHGCQRHGTVVGPGARRQIVGAVTDHVGYVK